METLVKTDAEAIEDPVMEAKMALATTVAMPNPPLSLLNESDKKDLINTLKDLNFTNKSSLAA